MLAGRCVLGVRRHSCPHCRLGHDLGKIWRFSVNGHGRASLCAHQVDWQCLGKCVVPDQTGDQDPGGGRRDIGLPCRRAWLAQRRLIYLPERDLTATPSEAMVTTVETSDGITHRVGLSRYRPSHGTGSGVQRERGEHEPPGRPGPQPGRRADGGPPLRLSGLWRHRWDTERGGTSHRCRGGGNPRLRCNAAGGVSR